MQIDLPEVAFLDNPPLRWLIAVGITAATFILVYMIRGFVRAQARRLARRERRGVADLLIRLASRLSITVVIVVAVVAGAQALIKHPQIDRALSVIVVLGLAWQFLLWGHVILDVGLAAFVRWRTPRDGRPDQALEASLGFIRFVVRTALYALVLLVAADNLGIDITALVAGLGITGIAVALAVQNILGDLFSSLSIVLDKPFVVGDYIVVSPDHQGTVERIGLKTTRVRSMSGEQLVFANSDLLSSRIRNFKRMAERRVTFVIGVAYWNTPDQLRRAQQMIEEAVRAQPNARFERAHLRGFAPNTLEFEAVYLVPDPDYTAYMDTQQAINLQVIERFAREGIEFWYPGKPVPAAAGPPAPVQITTSPPAPPQAPPGPP